MNTQGLTLALVIALTILAIQIHDTAEFLTFMGILAIPVAIVIIAEKPMSNSHP